MDDRPRSFAEAGRLVDKSEWQALCDRLSRALEGKEAEIEVMSLALGDQIEAEWRTLLGIVYDPKDDLIELALDGLDHLITHPRRLALQEGAGGVASILIIDEAGNEQLMRLRDPTRLPPTAAG